MVNIETIYQDGTAENTRRAYGRDLNYWRAWMDARGKQFDIPVPVATVELFITDHLGGMPEDVENILVKSGRKRPGPHNYATIKRRLASLSVAHNAMKVVSPCRDLEICKLMSAARRKLAREGRLHPNKKKALTLDLLNAMLHTCADDDNIWDVRDRALLLFAFASGGRRRSEITAARMENLERIRGGWVYTLPVSKTDQVGHGLPVPVLGRAADALALWLEKSGVSSGYIFRGIDRAGRIGPRLSDNSVNLIVKRRIEQVGVMRPGVCGAHSLRSGFMTQAGRESVPLRDAMSISGHKTIGIAMDYQQTGYITRNPAGKLVG